METTSNEIKQHKRPLWVRLLSLFLAVLLLSQALLVNAARVRFSEEKYEGSEYETAASLLKEDDEYLNASLMDRMRAIVRHVKKPESYDEYSMFASVAIADEKYAEAGEYLRECIRILERQEHSTQELAALYLKTGCVYGLNSEWDKAAGYLHNAAVKDPNNSDAWLMLAEANLRCEEYEDALDAMDHFAELKKPDADQLLAMTTMELVVERLDSCIAHCTELMSMEGTDSAAVLTMRAQAYLLYGDNDKALADADAALSAGGNEAELLPIKANAYEMTENYEQALVFYAQAVDQGNADSQTLGHAVSCAYLVDDYDAMYKFSKYALQLDLSEEERIEYRKWLGIAQLEKAEYVEAVENFSAYLEKNQDLTELYYLRGVCYMASEQYEQGIADFTVCIDADILSDECLYNRGLCYTALNKAAEARHDFYIIINRNKSPEMIAQAKEFLGID